jgi:hypothetical protein
MTELTFDVLGMEPVLHAAVPTLAARLRVAETTGERVHAIVLRCQVRIEPQRRRYSEEEADGLRDLFGTSGQWATTLKPFLWTHEATTVPGFTGQTEFELLITCTYDFEVVAAKYLHALQDGTIPLLLAFSGTAFFKGDTGFNVNPLPWHKDASWDLPVAAWRGVMDHYFPNSGWIRLQRDTLDALLKFKSRHGLPTWERAFDVLLREADERAGTP